MIAVFATIDLILSLITWIVIISAVLSWLFAFNVINPSNQFVSTVANALYQMTEPLLRPIRRFVPPMGGMDLSPLVLLVGIFFLRTFLQTSVAPAVLG
ncbi:MAG: YggT family protein [Pseudomonadota bacterium]